MTQDISENRSINCGIFKSQNLLLSLAVNSVNGEILKANVEGFENRSKHFNNMTDLRQLLSVS